MGLIFQGLNYTITSAFIIIWCSTVYVSIPKFAYFTRIQLHWARPQSDYQHSPSYRLLIAYSQRMCSWIGLQRLCFLYERNCHSENTISWFSRSHLFLLYFFQHCFPLSHINHISYSPLSENLGSSEHSKYILWFIIFFKLFF